MSAVNGSVETGEVNWSLLQRLAERPHRHLNMVEGAEYFLEVNGVRNDACGGIGEVMQEARTVQHLCDLAGVPEGCGYSAHIDARVYLLMQETIRVKDRLARIADWHSRISGPGGTFDDYCRECGEMWPCATRKFADGTEDVP